MRGHVAREAFGVSGLGSRLRRLIIRSLTTATNWRCEVGFSVRHNTLLAAPESSVPCAWFQQLPELPAEFAHKE